MSFRLLFVFIVLAHHRRRAIHFNVTAHPTAEWTARQIAEAFPWDSAPGYLLHDRDCIYGGSLHQRVAELGIREAPTAPRSPWQNAYAERFIGSLRRECPDHIVIFNDSSLRRILKAYFEYYEHSRTHLALEKDAPASRTVQPPTLGAVIELPQVGGFTSSLRAKSRLRLIISRIATLEHVSVPRVVITTLASSSLRELSCNGGGMRLIRLA